MELKNIQVITSPDEPQKLRYQGEVVYADKKKENEIIWYEFDKSYESFFKPSGDVWLLALIPAAVYFQEELNLPVGVNEKLLRNVHRLMLIWERWYSDRSPVRINALTTPDCLSLPGKKNIAFFSGGVDSFFTLLRHEKPSLHPDQIDIHDLINVWGFDIPHENIKEFQSHYNNIKPVADALNKELLIVRTNIRKTGIDKSGWGTFYFGCAMASTVHLFSDRYKNALLASGGEGIPELTKWGSTALTDPLYSSSNLELIHDGPTFTRMQKVQLLADSKLARQYLHVCWRQGTDTNCCQCEKCYRTMIALDAIGVLDEFKTFNASQYTSKSIKQICLTTALEIEYFFQVKHFARQRNRPDLIRALSWVIIKSKVICKALVYLNKIEMALDKTPFFWRFKYVLNNLLFWNATNKDSLIKNI